jgi:N-acetylglucosamine-6-phosphate deacetylase
MNQGDLCARHFETGEPVRVLWQNGRVLNIQRPNKTVPSDLWIAPALTDLQVNGYAGIDFQQDNLPLSALVTVTRRLAQDGCSRYLLTLISDHWDRMIARLRHLRELRQMSAELRHGIAGWHIEGPFLSAEPGFCGAHDPSVMIDPTEEHIRELRAVTDSDPILLTLAPERRGALEAIRLATSLGMIVSLGHTDASAEQIQNAAAAGARAFTHLGNGCPRTLDRHDNILWRVLEQPNLIVSLIPDAIHVSGPLFRLAHQLLASSAVLYVSDAMAAAAAGPGRYTIGRVEVEVGADQVVRLPGKPNFAGSALRPVQGVFRAARMLGCCRWQDTWTKFSHLPVDLMRWRRALERDGLADFCLLRVDGNGEARALRTFVNGVEVPAR